MARALQGIPYVIFAVLEPISLVAGWLSAWFDTANFVADQYPSPSNYISPTSANAQIISYQLGNLYLLMALMGLSVLNITNDPRIIRAYLIVLAIGDLGHVGPTAWVMGWTRVSDVATWNAMAWGNIAATVFLFVNRMAYVCGLYGGSSKSKIA
ncbi:hypothetical protein MMC25_003164 [Agyrium rufum]|nr:hypothetical protein [Agyrium rufum]